jgi:hypothetical protein
MEAGNLPRGALLRTLIDLVILQSNAMSFGKGNGTCCWQRKIYKAMDRSKALPIWLAKYRRDTKKKSYISCVLRALRVGVLSESGTASYT